MNTITSEKAYDMLPYAVDIYDKLDLDGFRKKLNADNKGKEKIAPLDAGIQGLKYILKNSAKVKEEVFQIVALADDKDIKEVKAQSIVETLKTFKAIYSNKDLVDFFKSAME